MKGNFEYLNKRYPKKFDRIPHKVNDNGLVPVSESYSLRECAYLFGVTRNTIRKWFSRRLLPAIRMLGATEQERTYVMRHRVLMKFIYENPDYEYVLDRLEGNLDRYEPATLEQKNLEDLRAIARSPREERGNLAAKHDPIHQNRNPEQPAKPISKWKLRELAKASRESAKRAKEAEWPW